jgi:hypothetical protein
MASPKEPSSSESMKSKRSSNSTQATNKARTLCQFFTSLSSKLIQADPPIDGNLNSFQVETRPQQKGLDKKSSSLDHKDTLYTNNVPFIFISKEDLFQVAAAIRKFGLEIHLGDRTTSVK